MYRSWIVPVLCILASACDDPDAVEREQSLQLRLDDISVEVEPADRGAPHSLDTSASQPYAHPLQGLQPLPDGRLPYLDAKYSPEGLAYAIAEGGFQRSEDAPEERFGGVVALAVRPMTMAEREQAKRPAHSRTRTDKLDRILRERIEDAGELATEPVLPVELHLVRSRTGTLTQTLQRAIAEGDVVTHRDYHQRRQLELEIVREEIAASTAPLRREIEVTGGEILYTCRYLPCLSARLTPAQVTALADHPSIRRIGLHETLTPDSLDGQEKADAYQTRMFWDESFSVNNTTYNYDGENGFWTDIRAAVLDDEGFRTSHKAFYDTNGRGSRIDATYDCRTGTCEAVDSYVNISDHGTAVLGTLLADYTDGQQPGLDTLSHQEQRTASAREARAYTYWASRTMSDQQAVYDQVVQEYPAPAMLVSSNSIGFTNDCSGESSKAIGADGVYEAGIAYFKSAGNLGGSANNCNVGPPGEAIGVFTVAGYDAPAGDDRCAMRTAPIHENSGWGGSTSDYDEGKFRSIVDIAGSYEGSNIPMYGSNTMVGQFVGTSHATPSVASAAINLIDLMKNHHNTNVLDDPGFVYAWMLNMGDRRRADGLQTSARFDHRTGAGNLKMRFIGNAGMDAPYYWYHYETCIDDGNINTLMINDGEPLSADVDSFRAVAWWYDRRIEDGIAIDNLNLRLKTTSGTLLGSSTDAWDNKERIYSSVVGDKAVKLEIEGAEVTSDVEGCGTNSMRVFVTILIEDDDRDDGDGPTYDENSCLGVERL